MAHLLTSTVLVLGILASVVGVSSNHSADSMATSLLLLGLGFLLLLFVIDRLCPSPSERSRRSGRGGKGRALTWLRGLPWRGWAVLGLSALVVPLAYLQFNPMAAEQRSAPDLPTEPIAAPPASQWQTTPPRPDSPDGFLSLRASARLTLPDTPGQNAPTQAAPAQPAWPTDVLPDAVEAWRAAWAAKDVERYLAAYAPTFVPADGRDLTAWKQWRRQRLDNANTIGIQIDALDIAPSPSGTEVLTRFVQHYRAGPVQDSVLKTLHWRHSDRGWHIVREESQPL